MYSLRKHRSFRKHKHLLSVYAFESIDKECFRKHNRFMATIYPLFGDILEQDLLGLQEPAAVEAEEDEFVVCEIPTARLRRTTSTIPATPQLDYGSAWVPMCDDCDTRRGRGRSLTCA